MTRGNKDAAPSNPPVKPNAATPEREAKESNYGYEADHPSYKQRKAGAWMPQHGTTKDHRSGDPPPIVPADVPKRDPATPGKNHQR